MSALVHCDGPHCDKTRDPEQLRRLSTPFWFRVEEGPDVKVLDFHDIQCLNDWAYDRRVVEANLREPG